MPSPWSAEIWRLLGVAALAFLLGLMIGYPVLLVLLGLLGYFIWHMVNLYRLERWLCAGRKFNPPEAGGIWGEVFHDIYQLQQRNRQRKLRLVRMLSQFQQATTAMPDATVVLGPHGEIQWFNDAANRLLGLHPTHDAGQRISNLVRLPEFSAFLNNGADGQTLTMPSPEDDSVTLNVRVVPYGRDQRLLIARDVSEGQRLEQMRRDFVANASHELRTPLTVINGFLETLADEDSECSQRWDRSLDLMQQQTLRMQRIVDDLLLLTRLETSRNRPPREAAGVPSMLGAIVDGAALISTERGHELHLNADPDLDLLGAENELHSAFNNLVANAVRYTPNGGRIDVRWYCDDDGAHMEVRDTGVGIPAEHIPRLTERFYRVDVGRSRDSGGTGLGLAIVKHVLTRHEGRLHIVSIPGKGSTFRCDFPLSRVVRE